MTTPRIVDHGDVRRRRLASQFLTTRGPKTASDVVRTLGAVQAQDYAGAKWALSMRTRGETDADIEAQIADGRILRTHVLRPTWHFVAPEDIRWMLALTAPRVNQAIAFHARFLELDNSVFRRSNDAISKALSGGKHLTRLELATALERARVKGATGQRLGHLVMRAELDGVVCSGARRGKQFTYALLDERVPREAARDRDEALLDLTRRYFMTRGPATAKDYAWWSGLAMSDVRRGIDLARADLDRCSMNGVDAWLVSAPRRRPAASAHLLPNYDEYFIAYKDRSAVGNRIDSTIAVTGGAANISHVLFLDGELVGGWKRAVDDEKAFIDIELWAKITADEASRIRGAVDAFGRFLGVTASIRRGMANRRGR